MSTKVEVRLAFRILAPMVVKLTGGQQCSLEEWSPGDGMTRYRVETIHPDTSVSHPLGESYWLGASNAYDGIWTAINAIRLSQNGITLSESHAEATNAHH